MDSVFEVEYILNHRKNISGEILYLVKWQGYPIEDSTWEPEANFSDPNMVRAYHAGLVGQNNDHKASCEKPKIPNPKKRKSETIVSEIEERPKTSSSSKRPGLHLSSSEEDVGTTTSKPNAPKHHRQRIVSSSSEDSNDSGHDDGNEFSNSSLDKNKVLVPISELEAEYLLDVQKCKGSSDLVALVKWKHIHGPEYVPIKIAHLKCPQMLIKFYENRIYWNINGGLEKNKQL